MVTLLVCPRCSHANPDMARFCNACGASMLDPGSPGAFPELPRPGARAGGRYELVREVGRGAFGMVFQARDHETGTDVAVKFLNVFLMASGAEGEKMRERFGREWHAGSKLSHPRIVRMLGAGEERSIPFLVMELVDGETLGQILAREGALALERGVHLVSDVLEALEHAHRAGVIHRDVKPSNVMVDPGGRARLMDFGIAKLMETFSGSLMTQTGLLGTPSYMSPEQASGRKIDHRSDLFSVGLLAYEVFTGRRAYEGHPASIINQILTKPLPPAPQLPVALQAWLEKACAKEPDARFPSAEAMRLSLGGVAERLESLAALETMAAPAALVPQPRQVTRPPIPALPVPPPDAGGFAVQIRLGSAPGSRGPGAAAPKSRRKRRRKIPVLAVAAAFVAVAIIAMHDSPPRSERRGASGEASIDGVPVPPFASQAREAVRAQMAEAVVAQGSIALEQDQPERAMRAFQRALQLDPACDAAQKGLEDAEEALQEAVQAREVLKQVPWADLVLEQVALGPWGGAAVVRDADGDVHRLKPSDVLQDGVVLRVEPQRIVVRVASGERAGQEVSIGIEGEPPSDVPPPAAGPELPVPPVPGAPPPADPAHAELPTAPGS